MQHSANDTATQRSHAETNQSNANAARKQILTVPLPESIAKNIEAITSFQTQENRALPAYQRLLEAIASFFGRSLFLYCLLFLLVV